MSALATDSASASEFTETDGWLIDARNNRCLIEYFGSRDAAEAALKSLKNCDDCTNCSDCSRCSRCSDCSGCSGCSGCSDCSRCSRCSGCSDCSDCSGCSGCSGCSDCSRCSRCSGCSDCSDCSGCSGCSGCSRCSRCSRCSDCSDCSGCSRCSRCSRCSDCSDCAYLYDQRSMRPAAAEGVGGGVPPVPVIPDIHKAVLDAVSHEGALDMGRWHDDAYNAGGCGTTHCRAGWVVALAGEQGRALEEFHNTELAAMLIYSASGHPISPVRFHETNEQAMADMRALAQADVG